MNQPFRLPLCQDVEALPLWARVAFAARCARRVLPLLLCAKPHAAESHQVTVARAVEQAERSAGRGQGNELQIIDVLSGITELVGDPTQAAGPASDSGGGGANLERQDRVAAHVGQAARCAAITALKVSGRPAPFRTDHYAVESAIEATMAVGVFIDAFEPPRPDPQLPPPRTLQERLDRPRGQSKQVDDLAWYAARNSSLARMIVSVRKDFDLIAQRAREHAWEDTTPVPPEVFGALWPDAPPVEWAT